MAGSIGAELHGTVERVVFRNEANGWTVLELDDGQELQKVVGVLPMASVGEHLKMLGNWVEHPSFGHQFRAETCERTLPAGADAILRYLSSGAVKGIGPSTAVRIVDKFGDEALDIMEKEPARLAEVRGISPSKAQKIGEEFAAQYGLREVMLFFAQYGLTPNEALRCWKRWGNAAIERVRENPYILCENGLYIGFERADQISLGMNRLQDDPRRVEAGLLYVLRHNLGNGHTCLPRDKLVRAASALLGVGEEAVGGVLDEMAASAFSVREEELDGGRFFFLQSLYRAETYAAARIRMMTDFPPVPGRHIEECIDAIERDNGIRYEAQQRRAIMEAVEKGVLILTGGPGTGKTTTLRAIITLLENMGETVALAAPTGRAAKRMAELTGREAKTIHRLLEVQWDDDSSSFARNEKNPLDADALVLDEVSMVDVLLFESVLRAMKSGSRLILVGDADQLPPVGPGCVLQDLMASGALPVVQLTEVFRQAMRSRIVSNAHLIVAGRQPELDDRTGDFFFLPQNGEQAVIQTVLDLCHHRLPDRYGHTVYSGLQVLCPGRKGELGTREVNLRLQELLNPQKEGKKEMRVEGTLLRCGDKVMHTRNNYDIGWLRDDGEAGSGVFNGDIGILEEIDVRQESLSVRYDDRVAFYSKEDAKDLELAYAVTVHKSQGSEFEAVILPLFRNQRQLCYRNLLYTAVTRAKSLLVIVGSRRTLTEMAENNRKTLRYSGLRHFLLRPLPER